MTRFRVATCWAVILLIACVEPAAQGFPGLEPEEREVRPLPIEVRFSAVRDITSAGGFLWVLDSDPPFLSRISSQTGDVLQFGREGEGPGEFLAPWAIQPNPDSSGVLVWDFGSYRTTEFDLSGRVKGSMPMSSAGRIRFRSRFSQTSYADPFRVRAAPGGYLAALFDRRLDHTSDFNGGIMCFTDQKIGPGQQVVSMADLVTPGGDGLKEWASVPFWDVCSDGLVVWKPNSGEIVRFDLDWRSRGKTAVEIPRVEIQHQDIERYLEWMARLEIGPEYDTHGIDFGVMARQNRDRFANYRPAVTDLRCQGGNTVWLRLFSTESDQLGRGDVWILAQGDGRISAINTPPGFTPFLLGPAGPIGPFRLPGGDEVLAQLVSPHNPIPDST